MVWLNSTPQGNWSTTLRIKKRKRERRTTIYLRIGRCLSLLCIMYVSFLSLSLLLYPFNWENSKRSKWNLRKGGKKECRSVDLDRIGLEAFYRWFSCRRYIGSITAWRIGEKNSIGLWHYFAHSPLRSHTPYKYSLDLYIHTCFVCLGCGGGDADMRWNSSITSIMIILLLLCIVIAAI